MEKKNYGVIVNKITKYVDKNELYLDDKKLDSVIKNIIEQFEIIEESLNSISIILGRSVDVVGKNRLDVVKDLKRRTKSQADSVRKLSESLSTKYDEDARNYPLKLLNDRIAEIEKKLAELS